MAVRSLFEAQSIHNRSFGIRQPQIESLAVAVSGRKAKQCCQADLVAEKDTYIQSGLRAAVELRLIDHESKVRRPMVCTDVAELKHNRAV